LLEEVEHG